MRLPVLALLLLPFASAHAAEKGLTPQGAVTFFIEAQDVPPFTPEQMSDRLRVLGDEPEAAAADAALNAWKQCVQDALVHWAPLNLGPGAVIDGAFGRCADIQRDYRINLVKMTPGGRQVIDTQLARNMTRTLEDSWRPRLTAAVLDQMLARTSAAPPAAAPAREPSTRGREERSGGRPSGAR